MKRKIAARTGGLLELIAVDGTRKEPPLAYNNTKTGTEAHFLSNIPYNQDSCFKMSSHQEALRLIHMSSVQYIHRSVAEFLLSASPSHVRVAENESLRQQAVTSVALAILMRRLLGSQCVQSWSYSTVSALLCIIRTLPALRAFDVLLRIESEAGSFFQKLSSGVRRTCPWSHAFFQYHIAYHVFYSFGLGDTYLDVPGLAAADGCLEFLEHYENSLPKRWSPYYKGYLLLCASNGLSEEWNLPREAADMLCARKAQVVNWLVKHDADLLTPQLRLRSRFADVSIMVRPPVVQCWLFVLELLKEHSHHLIHFRAVLEELMQRINRHMGNDSQTYVWCIGKDLWTCECEFPLVLDGDVYSIVFVMHSTLEALMKGAWKTLHSCGVSHYSVSTYHCEVDTIRPARYLTSRLTGAKSTGTSLARYSIASPMS